MKKLILLAILLLPTVSLADGRGIAGPGGNNVPGVAQIMQEQGADWFYTWRAGERDTPGWVPMFYHGLTGALWQIQRVQIITGRGYVGGYWLIGNEPHHNGISTVDAVTQYAGMVGVIKEGDPSGKPIIGGWITPSLGRLAAFRQEWHAQRGCWPEEEIAGYHVHLYTNFSPDWRSELEAWLDATPGMECWVTEYGQLDHLDADTLTEMTLWLDANERVDRYAVFYAGLPNGEWPRTSLYVWDGDTPVMTDLGRTYAALATVPTVTPTVAPQPTPEPQAPVYRLYVPFYESFSPGEEAAEGE